MRAGRLDLPAFSPISGHVEAHDPPAGAAAGLLPAVHGRAGHEVAGVLRERATPVTPHPDPVRVVVVRLHDLQLPTGLLALPVELLERALVVLVGPGGQHAGVPELPGAALVGPPHAADLVVLADHDVDDAEALCEQHVV